MHLSNKVGLGEAKHVAVVAERLRMVAEPLAPKLRVAEASVLEHDAHRPVEDHDPLLEELLKALFDRGRRHGDQ